MKKRRVSVYFSGTGTSIDTISRYSRRSSSLVGDRHKKALLPPRPKVFDKRGRDVTPVIMYHPPPPEPQICGGKTINELFASQISRASSSTSTYAAPSSSSSVESSPHSSPSPKDSGIQWGQDSFPPHDQKHPAPPGLKKSEKEKQDVTEEMLDISEEIRLSETATISLLDIASNLISKDMEEANTIIEKNDKYARLCRNKVGNDKYVERFTQTLEGAFKNKLIQSDKVIEVHQGTTATNWHIYDAFAGIVQVLQRDEADGLQHTVEVQKHGENRGDTSSGYDTVAFQSEITLLSLDHEQTVQEILQSESVKLSLRMMERLVMANIAESELSTLQDSDSAESPGSEKKTLDSR